MKEGYKVAKAVSNTKFKTGDKVKCINNTLVEQWFSVGKTYTVAVAYSDNEHIGFIHTGFAVWHSDRFELIEKEDTVKEPKQFNPHPGDKITCNNGEEFTCCTKEFLFSKGVLCYMDSGIYSYRVNPENNHTNIIWMYWSLDGKPLSGDKEWNIREVIPKDASRIGPFCFDASLTENSVLSVDFIAPSGLYYADKNDATQESYMEFRRNQDGTLSALNVYTAEDIRSAFIDDLSWTESYLEMFMKSLGKVTNPEYKEYLRLKDMFENEQ